MKAYTYIEKGRFELKDKPEPKILDSKDAIVKVTLASICTSDLHIKHGSVPRAVPRITVGHEMVGIVTEVGEQVHSVKPGDRVTVNVETYCGECWFCKHGYVNTASPLTAAGRSAAESTEARRNSSASRMPTRDSTVPMLMLYLKEVFNK